MSDLAINPLSVTTGRFPAAAGQLQSQPAGEKTTAPKTDVIDLSKPPTEEQVERLRKAGILGYGSISVTKNITTESLSNDASVTHFTVDYQAEYFDLVHETTVRTSSTGIGVFTSGGSAYASTTSQLTCSWDNSSWKQSTLYEGGFSLEVSGKPSWYVPPKQSEDGSWDLAQYGPAHKTTISGYHSLLTVAQSSGGQTQISQYATAAYKVVTMLPSQERPAGAVDYKNGNLHQATIQEMLNRLNKFAQAFPGFHTQA